MKIKIVKVVFTLYALLMPAIASGTSQTSIVAIREGVEQKPRWSAEYNYDGYKIEVDIPIIVPQTDKMPVISVKPWRPFDEEKWKEKFFEVEERGNKESGYICRSGEKGLYSFLNPNGGEGITRVYYFKNAMDDYENFLSKDYIHARHNSSDVMLNVNGKRLERDGESYYLYEMERNKSYAENSNITVNDAIKCTEDIIHYYYETDDEIEVDYVKVYSRGRDKNGNVYDKNPSGSYYIKFWQKINGIPLFNTASSIYPSVDANDGLITELRRIELLGSNFAEIMSREESYEIFVTMMKANEVVSDDAMLIEVDDIIKNIEKYIKEGFIRNVYSIRLGYVCFLKDKTSGEFVLYPMWRIECDYMKPSDKYTPNNMSADFRNGFDYNYVYINACTGEVLTDVLVSPDQIVCPQL